MSSILLSGENVDVVVYIVILPWVPGASEPSYITLEPSNISTNIFDSDGEVLVDEDINDNKNSFLYCSSHHLDSVKNLYPLCGRNL
ncbi:MAG: hypothetical protein AMDU5_GPLC00001G0033 [Thermoplasmatales archaeon Gpl]|nr:MAG: hypothetical protein AMDU5_GPLC00001G0033 [Thermoplasmatales archaeon Gpl]